MSTLSRFLEGSRAGEMSDRGTPRWLSSWKSPPRGVSLALAVGALGALFILFFFLVEPGSGNSIALAQEASTETERTAPTLFDHLKAGGPIGFVILLAGIAVFRL